CARGPGMDYW
nr:immunoglobulin heavy chain junction region [Mus musculus]MBK4197230.1 immunoglobulin heavy chain junction region [Mus musculus]MBK4197231.1 immunoglobulin heavy chain junction region [Mus musculus]